MINEKKYVSGMDGKSKVRARAFAGGFAALSRESAKDREAQTYTKG
jgi:hypothetical protein